MRLVGVQHDRERLSDERMDYHFQCLAVEREPAQAKIRAQLTTRALHVYHLAVRTDAQRGVAGGVGAEFVDELEAWMPNLVGHERVEAIGRTARAERQARILPLRYQVEHQVEALRYLVDVGEVDDMQ